jgi:hypothetical protein
VCNVPSSDPSEHRRVSGHIVVPRTGVDIQLTRDTAGSQDVLSPGFPTRGHPIARSPRDGGPSVLGATSTCDEMAPPAPKHVRQLDSRNSASVSSCQSSRGWLAAACARPTSWRSRNAGAAIHRVDFRHRVLVAASYHFRFEPRSGGRNELATSRRGSGRG